MAGRRVLVIGSQNQGKARLPFLPVVAERLHALMTTGPGECVGVELKDRPAGLLIDPAVDEMKSAIRAAVDGAAMSGDALIIAYVGHGDVESGRFYLRPMDSDRPTPECAVDLVEVIGKRLLEYDNFSGLTVLVDACHGGMAVRVGMELWGQLIRSLKDFEFLSPSDLDETSHAVLFDSLCTMLERGDPVAGDRIVAGDVARRLTRIGCTPQLTTFNRSVDLGRNNAKDPGEAFWNWPGHRGKDVILRQTWYFQPTTELHRLVEASESDPVVVLTGAAGTGKSTLASALVRPELTNGAVPEGFVQGIAILNAQTTDVGLAGDLEKQLRRTVLGFAEAAEEFQRSVPLEEWRRLDYVARKVVRPLHYLPHGSSVRIVLDAFDQLSEPTRTTVLEAFAERPPTLQLIVTSHSETPGFLDARRLAMASPEVADQNAYLLARDVDPKARAVILDVTKGQWLITALLADAVLADPGLDLSRLPGTVEDAYAKRLEQATGGGVAAWRDRFCPVLSLIAIAGTGPVLPLPLLVHASAILGGPSSDEAVLATLDALGGLVVRGDAHSPADHVGLFHITLVEYLLSKAADGAGFAIDALAAHRAMIGAIDALAPLSKRLKEGPLHRYAFLREAHHLWAIDEFAQVYGRLYYRISNMPMENLSRYEEWSAIFEHRFGINARVAQHLRYEAASGTAASGDARKALAKFDKLLLDQLASIGPLHRDTLGTKSCIASLTGELRNAPEALKQLEELLLIQEHVLGYSHPYVLTTRHNIAFWRGLVGDRQGAWKQFEDVLPRRASRS